MKRLLSIILMFFLGVYLVGCSAANRYDFVYEISKDNYEKLIDIDFETIDNVKFIKYELKEKGYIESLIVTVESRYNFYIHQEENITMTEENVLYPLSITQPSYSSVESVVGCLGTLYTDQFQNVFGLSLSKAKSDVKELNESLEIFNDHHFYTVESELNALNIRITSQLGFRSDPFYFYILTPFERTAYSHEASTGIVTKKYQDAKTDTISYLTEAEMIEELGLEETNSFLLPDTLSVYKEKENVFYIFGVIEDLKGSFFPEETFDDISYNAKFKMKIKIVSDDELLLDFDILDDDIEYNFSFEYDFTKFGDIDYLFDLG
jgi:hypothetical protein